MCHLVGAVNHVLDGTTAAVVVQFFFGEEIGRPALYGNGSKIGSIVYAKLLFNREWYRDFVSDGHSK